MKTRKIFAAAMAGLCAVSTMGISTFAADETIETSGAKSYKVSAGFQAPAIDVTVPDEVAAIINPYMIEVKLSDTVKYEAEGVASPKYTITNNSTEVGINVKATFSAEGLDGLVATADEAVKTDAANNKDKKKLAFVTLNATTPMEIETAAGTVDAGDDNQLVFSADAANPEKTDVLMKLDVKGTDGSGEFWIGGAVIEEPAEKWTASDKLSINVVLDINPFNTGATTTTDPIDTAVTSITFTSDGTAPTPDKAFDAATTTYSLTGCANKDELTFNVTAATGYSLSYAFTDGAAGTGTSNVCTVKTGTNTLVITVTDDSDSTNTKTYTYTIVV